MYMGRKVRPRLPNVSSKPSKLTYSVILWWNEANGKQFKKKKEIKIIPFWAGILNWIQQCYSTLTSEFSNIFQKHRNALIYLSSFDTTVEKAFSSIFIHHFIVVPDTRTAVPTLILRITATMHWVLLPVVFPSSNSQTAHKPFKPWQAKHQNTERSKPEITFTTIFSEKDI